MHRRVFLGGAALAALSACSAAEVWAPEAQVAAATYRGPGPRALTLYTMKSTQSDNGAHSGLLIDASQRVLFDPAGSFAHPSIPERNDVLFGFSPRVEDYYVSYHARETFYVIGQRIVVPAETAEMALRLALANGPVPQGFCSRATSALLRQLPGFESIGVTFLPNNLADDFGRLPGVESQTFRETDADDNSRLRGAAVQL